MNITNEELWALLRRGVKLAGPWVESEHEVYGRVGDGFANRKEKLLVRTDYREGIIVKGGYSTDYGCWRASFELDELRRECVQAKDAEEFKSRVDALLESRGFVCVGREA